MVTICAFYFRGFLATRKRPCKAGIRLEKGGQTQPEKRRSAPLFHRVADSRALAQGESWAGWWAESAARFFLPSCEAQAGESPASLFSGKLSPPPPPACRRGSASRRASLWPAPLLQVRLVGLAVPALLFGSSGRRRRIRALNGKAKRGGVLRESPLKRRILSMATAPFPGGWVALPTFDTPLCAWLVPT